MRTCHTRKSNLKKSGFAGHMISIYSDHVASSVKDISDQDNHSEELNYALSDFADNRSAIKWCINILKKSPLAYAMFDKVQQYGWRFVLSDIENGGFHLDASDRIAHIDNHGLTPQAISHSSHFRNSILVSLARALRDIWHEEKLCDIEKVLSPEDLLMLERARTADGDIVAVFIGWELRCEGHAEIWRHLISSEESDIAMTISRFASECPNFENISKTLEHAYRKWHLNENRVNSCDHDILEFMDDILEESECEAPFGETRINGEMLESVSELPGGYRYLHGKGKAIISDPNYCGMKDEINNAHLLQIVHDAKSIIVEGVPFRSAEIASKVFPDEMLNHV